jgi:hypothetical protein
MIRGSLTISKLRLGRWVNKFDSFERYAIAKLLVGQWATSTIKGKQLHRNITAAEAAAPSLRTGLR